jgi:hypothetical protein
VIVCSLDATLRGRELSLSKAMSTASIAVYEAATTGFCQYAGSFNCEQTKKKCSCNARPVTYISSHCDLRGQILVTVALVLSGLLPQHLGLTLRHDSSLQESVTEAVGRT